MPNLCFEEHHQRFSVLNCTNFSQIYYQLFKNEIFKSILFGGFSSVCGDADNSVFMTSTMLHFLLHQETPVLYINSTSNLFTITSS